MPERYAQAILKYLADRQYQPLKPRQLARQMGIAEEDYGTFREAVKVLRDSGRIVLGAKQALMLPQVPSKVTGFYRANPRGFGFVTPETPYAHGDLFIPPGAAGGAMTGDRVVARVTMQGRRAGKAFLNGEIVEILQRGQNRFVGTLQQTEGTWFVLPDGSKMTQPIVVRDLPSWMTAVPKGGQDQKVVAEIIQYPAAAGELPTGVIVETLGEKGELEVETLSVIRAHGIEVDFSPEALADARAAIEAFDPATPAGREDLSAQTIVTIDPPDARDFDDAIGLEETAEGFVLGVHIADVSHFVVEGTRLDDDARQRSTSVYFPRKVVPMLPEILSNGVCSLQEGQPRYCKSAFITYDRAGNILRTRFAETIIRSAKRLTYLQAQGIIDGQVGGYRPEVIRLVQRMNTLARVIEVRRRRAGMLHLDLPAVELVFDEHNRVRDAVPEDNAYTHTIIEMFMVEANEAVASLFDRLDRPFLRRIHPSPDQVDSKQLIAFVHACGHKLTLKPSRREIQDLLDTVRGRPESYAVNLALLKTFQQAEYSPMRIGHFALASENYCHFTSPIRRYPDLMVHRLLAEYCRGRLATRPPEDLPGLMKQGEFCSAAERRAQAAEDELREVLILQFLENKIGDAFRGVVTGVTNFGIFVQSPQFLVEGLLRMEDLGDDWWEVNPATGQVVGEHTGRRFRIGDLLDVRIAAVDIARRQLNLVLDRQAPAKTPQKQKKHGKGNQQKPRQAQPQKKNQNQQPNANQNSQPVPQPRPAVPPHKKSNRPDGRGGQHPHHKKGKRHRRR